jgi:hypothetical protein
MAKPTTPNKMIKLDTDKAIIEPEERASLPLSGVGGVSLKLGDTVKLVSLKTLGVSEIRNDDLSDGIADSVGGTALTTLGLRDIRNLGIMVGAGVCVTVISGADMDSDVNVPTVTLE